ncbi:hypothetical protein [Microcoleus sp. CAWBG640]|uniref:hypothetical protein n=1 Tax=Microcoleus sp. CAWBG640 TaxID=2841653 RepID=UPI00312BC818
MSIYEDWAKCDRLSHSESKRAIAPLHPAIPKAIALFLFTRAHIQLVNMITYQQNRCTIARI